MRERMGDVKHTCPHEGRMKIRSPYSLSGKKRERESEEGGGETGK